MKSKSFETFIYSTLGVVAVLLMVVAINFIAGVLRSRVDLTQEQLYTLSDGTKKILSGLDGKLKIRFYCTQNDPSMPVHWRNYAQRVDDLLVEYKKYSGGKIEIERLNPQPDTDAEDWANMDGVQPRQVSITDSVYLGLSFTFLDEKVALPFLPIERENFLEYDISRAIARLLHPERPVIGVMSGLPVFGMQIPPQMAMQTGQRGQDPWMFITELQKDFEVEQVQMDTDKIDEKIKFLIVHHPKDISDKAQFAIDQFVMRGGRLMVFLDPFTAMEQQRNPMMGGPPQGGSNLEKLLKAWGLEFDSSKVLVDLTLQSQRYVPRFRPFIPSFSPEYIKQGEIITGQLDNLVMAFAGVFTGSPKEGLKLDVLMHSSPNCQLVDRFMAQMAGEQVAKDFKSADKEYNVAVRLTGKFKTAFPDGKPEEKSDDAEKKDDEKKEEPKKEDFLKESEKENAVILVGDADMLHEQFYANVQDLFGQKIMMVHSGNLTFLQNVAELLSGDSNLINARSRATKSRNFTLIREIRARAAASYQAELQKLEEKKNETQRKINEIQAKKDPAQGRMLSQEQIDEIERYRKEAAQTNQRLKETRKELRREEESLENRLKLINIAGMPVIVIALGIGLAIYNRKRTAAK